MFKVLLFILSLLLKTSENENKDTFFLSFLIAPPSVRVNNCRQTGKSKTARPHICEWVVRPVG